jgi:DNA-binding transcriptional ArsR family regulator
MTEQDKDRLSPDDAFSALGNEIRVQILRELGDAGEPLAFSTLYDRIDLSDSAQFNYHLDKLVGHFVKKTEAGYALGRPGRRIVEAILSGAVTEDPQLDRTPVADCCDTCGQQLEIQWRDGSVELFCTDCDGRWEQSWGRVGGPQETADGYLGRLPFPPAGLKDRDPTDVLQSAFVWSNLELLAVANELCPRCAARVEIETHVCDNHDDSESPCSACETNFAVRLVATCTNCIYSAGSGAAFGLLDEPALLTFLFDHGLNPFAPESVHEIDQVLNEYGEEIETVDPLRATLRFTIDTDTLSLTVDGKLNTREYRLQ